ncbi:MAG TPA: AAA family ATPase [Armatimonadetes bacterium]|jgi:predicted ATPase|nr:AAA family ATPase [Armatimonadota bacterium]
MHLTSIRLHPEKYPTTEQYPFSLALFQQTVEIPLTTPVTLLVGENGTGKSTLLEALARKCGIHIWQDGSGRSRHRPNPYEQYLHHFMSIEWTNGRVPGSFFGSDIFQDFVAALEEWAVADPGQLKYFGGESLQSKSHGQSLMAYFTSRYQIEGLYLLDEPETALSPGTQLQLLKLIHQTSKAGHAQFIMATHSPILLACPGASIYSFDHSPVSSIPCEKTEHYRVYREFMADPERFLAELDG